MKELEEYYNQFSKEEVEKAKELAQKYFPDSESIWARENIEQQKTIFACLEIAKWKEQQMIEKACDAYCRICDTQECFNDGNCNWVEKFRKAIKK
jgi:hypothetical protein